MAIERSWDLRCESIRHRWSSKSFMSWR